jgi:hypothetical protein
MMESLMLIVPSSGSREAVVIVMFAVPKLVTRSFILMFAPVRAFSKVLVRGLSVIAVVRALEIVIFVGSSNSVPIRPFYHSSKSQQTQPVSWLNALEINR